jgi:hypothetical protein
MVIGCAYVGFPVVGPVGQSLRGLDVAGVPIARGFKAVKAVSSTRD